MIRYAQHSDVIGFYVLRLLMWLNAFRHRRVLGSITACLSRHGVSQLTVTSPWQRSYQVSSSWCFCGRLIRLKGGAQITPNLCNLISYTRFLSLFSLVF